MAEISIKSAEKDNEKLNFVEKCEQQNKTKTINNTFISTSTLNENKIDTMTNDNINENTITNKKDVKKIKKKHNNPFLNNHYNKVDKNNVDP